MKRRTWIVGLGTLAAIVAGAGLWWVGRPAQVYTDGAAIQRSTRGESPRQVLWEPPRPVEALDAISMEIYEPRTSWDGRTLYFVGGKTGENADIFTATRTLTGWSEPTPLEGVNSEYDDLGPQPTPDGKSVYFYSDRPGGRGGYDLWVVHRSDEDTTRWLEAINLGPGVNSEWNDYGPAVSSDGATLLFASNRPRPEDTRQADPGAWSATVRESFFNRPYDLYRSALGPAGAGEAAQLNLLNSPASEGAPCFSPAGDFVYFASDRQGGRGGFDLYRSRLLRGDFQPPENLGSAVNTTANELDPGMAAIGFELFFSSDRILAPSNSPQTQPAGGAVADARHYRLFRTTTREVFLEDVARKAIDWAGLMSALWPNLLWLLLGLLALLLLLLLFRDMRDRRLSLLARCLLASLLAHCLLLTAFGFWRISTAVADFVRGRSQVQIVLADTSVSAPLVTQIRGNLTDTPAVTPLATETPQVEPVAAEITPPSVELASVETVRTVEPAALRMDPRESRVAESTPPAMRSLEVSQPQTPDVALPQDAATAKPVAEATVEVAAAAVEMTPQPLAPSPAPAAANVALEPVTRTESPAIESRLPTPVESKSETRRESLRTALPNPAVARSDSDLALSLPVESRVDRTASQPVERDAASLAAAVNGDELPRPTVTTPTASQPAFAMAPDDSREAESPRPLPDVKIDARDANASKSAVALPPTRHQAGAAPMPEFALPNEAALANPSNAAIAERGTPQLEPLPAGRAAPIDVRAGMASQPMKAVEIAPMRAPAASPEGGLALASDAKIEFRDAARVSDPRRVGPLPASTAAPALALELSLPAETEPELRSKPIGALHGVIRDATTSEPIGGATVRVDLADGEPVLVQADSEGRYSLLLPQVPDHFALTAAADGFLPDSKSIAEADIEGRSMQVDFSLKPANETVVAVEDEPEVHHLGNDRFEGAINSQFQRATEGAALLGEFSLSASQAPPNLLRARITVMVKGVQCPHRVYVNGELIKGRIDKSPEDGSFGEISVSLPAELLREGVNTVEIRAVSCRGDLDDFEFVNVQIHLIRTEGE